MAEVPPPFDGLLRFFLKGCAKFPRTLAKSWPVPLGVRPVAGSPPEALLADQKRYSYVVITNKSHWPWVAPTCASRFPGLEFEVGRFLTIVMSPFTQHYTVLCDGAFCDQTVLFVSFFIQLAAEIILMGATAGLGCRLIKGFQLWFMDLPLPAVAATRLHFWRPCLSLDS